MVKLKFKFENEVERASANTILLVLILSLHEQNIKDGYSIQENNSEYSEKME